MKHSEQFSEVAKALVSARKSFSKAKKTGKNNHLNNTYANLTDILDAVQPSLDEHELFVSQYMLDTSTDSVMHLETMILHSSGQYMKFQYNMPIEKKTAQAYGSTTSYARRYALAAALGITQTDDDAEVAKLSVDDYKRIVAATADLDSLRAIHESAKRSLSTPEWKILEPALIEKKAMIVAADGLTGSDDKPEKKTGGFNHNKPKPVNKTVDTTQDESKNKTQENIESFE